MAVLHYETPKWTPDRNASANRNGRPLHLRLRLPNGAHLVHHLGCKAIGRIGSMPLRLAAALICEAINTDGTREALGISDSLVGAKALMEQPLPSNLAGVPASAMNPGTVNACNRRG